MKNYAIPLPMVLDQNITNLIHDGPVLGVVFVQEDQNIYSVTKTTCYCWYRPSNESFAVQDYYKAMN